MVNLPYPEGLRWYLPVAGALRFLNLSDCAWRDERWAYYSLMFLNIIGCLTPLLLISSPRDPSFLELTIILLGASIGRGHRLRRHLSSPRLVSPTPSRHAMNPR